MIKISNIHSLSEFKRNTSELTGKMEASGDPLILTVNGKAKYVVLDSEKFQEMADQFELLKVIHGIREGYEDAQAGKSRSAKKFFAEFEKKHGIRR